MKGSVHEVWVNGEMLGFGYVSLRFESGGDEEARSSAHIDLIENYEPEVIR